MKLKVDLGKRSYPILIGPGQTASLSEHFRSGPSRKVFLIADSRLKQARKKVLGELKKTSCEVFEIPVVAGERLKETGAISRIFSQMIMKGADRNSVIVAVGGGSVGDAVGFVASVYMRGIEWIGVPTTLLAQVDSSVGGKTAINHTLGKNLIGTFHQPSLVICDTDFLKTLSQREMNSGMGEILKYAITYDPTFYRFLFENLDRLLNHDSEVLETAIACSLGWKCKAVEKDEYDRTGIREVLNFGHTFGHALEALTKFKKYQHGEAVLLGMRFALALSVQRKWLSKSNFEEVDALLSRIQTPPLPKKMNFSEILKHMKKDKKSREGRVRFILLKRLGKTQLDHEVTESDLRSAFESFTKSSKKGVR